MRYANQYARVVAALGLAWGAAMMPTPAHALYALVGEIPVNATAANPFNTSGQLNGAFTSYDISFFDANTQLDYVADRANAAVDIFSAATNAQVGSVGGFNMNSPLILPTTGVSTGATLSTNPYLSGAQASLVTSPNTWGTTVNVSRLFYNAPARQKFLRSARSEWRSLLDVISTMALTRRDVSIALTHDPKLDDMALIEALRSDAFYVGALGSSRNQAARKKRLAEHFEYQKLLDLFGPGESAASSLSLVGSLP